MSETYEYITFNTRLDQSSGHTLSLDDDQTEKHIQALIRDGGSTSESLVNAFVKDKLVSVLTFGKGLNGAWDRLDAFQHDLVLQLRVLVCTRSGPQGDEPFVNFFYRQCVENIYDELVEGHDDYDDLSIEQRVAIAEDATKQVNAILAKCCDELYPRPFSVMVEKDEWA